MNHIEDMIHTHPRQETAVKTAATCIDACYECAEVCSTCVDACVAEGDADLAGCIRLNLDCADICIATGKILSRLISPDDRVVKAQLLACIAACRACGDMCEHHALHYEHCRICAETCRVCEQLCLQTVSEYSARHLAPLPQ